MKWFLGVALLLVLALVLESGLLVYATYVLLGLLVLSRVLARNWIAHVHADRECNRVTAEVGDTIAVNVNIHNDGWLPVPWLILEDLLPAKAVLESRQHLKVKKRRIKIAMLLGHGRLHMN